MQFQKTQVGEGRLMMVDNGATEGVDFVVLVRFLIPTSFGLKICKLHTQKLYNLALPPLRDLLIVEGQVMAFLELNLLRKQY